MQLLDGRPVYSASDLNNFLACRHLTALDRDVLRGRLVRPTVDGGQGPLLSKLGEEHEQRYLQQLLDAGRRVTSIARGRGLDGIVQAAADTEAAMARGDEYVYQATFYHDGWVGHADFLRCVPQPLVGGRWPWHYEVEDTKLARHTEPYFLLQLAYYSDHVRRIQGAWPEHMHVALGNQTIATFRVDDVTAYYHRVRARFAEFVADDDAATYPDPIAHCGLCVWNAACGRRRIVDDHLSLVANITRLQTERLNTAGVATLEELARATHARKPAKMAGETFAKLHRQARLQSAQRIALAAGEPYPWKYEILPSGDDAKRGFFRLPPPSPGDVFFDMEGDPYYDLGTGLEYLFGAYTPDGEFRAFWGCDRSAAPAHDRLAEKRAFEAFVDFVLARRARYPDLHVYHYASYEKSALQKLAQRHLTREDAVDLILREELLVDLYAIVRQAIAVGQPSYSIKKLEDFYGKRRLDATIAAGDDSILRFEEWLAGRRQAATRDDEVLVELERYNRYDCVSTYDLREWLLRLRREAEALYGHEIPPYAGKDVAPPAEDKDPYLALKLELDTRIPDDFDPADPDRDPAVWPYFAARHMLEYHWREAKPIYWRFHDRCDTFREEPLDLLDDPECIVGLQPVGAMEAVPRNWQWTFRYPAQLIKIEDGACYDLAFPTQTFGRIHAIDDGEVEGTLVIRRGRNKNDPPPASMPQAITVRKIVSPSTVRDALARFAAALLAEGASMRYRAAYDVLLAGPPRLTGRAAGEPIQPASPDEASVRALCDALDASYLFVQGPPGSGKTHLGARLIVGLIADGKRVGVMANSHRAIHNLLDAVVEVAAERRVHVVGIKKSTKDDEETYYTGAGFTNSDSSIADPAANLVAGTAWAFGAERMDRQLDYLFVDEAGQVALPAAIAGMTAATNTVFLGDPLQLAQVSHTQHPGNLGASVLEHLLGGELRPVAPDRGVLLTNTYRMHADVCAFISGLLYEGRLHAVAACNAQAVESSGIAGTGLRYIPVEHTGNRQSSPEEAARIVAEVGALLGGRVCDTHGVWRRLEPADIMVVTPYNAQVRCIRRALEAATFAEVEVGTVDKFQGREAYVVFFSTAASTPDEAARGVSFIFDRQRLNVAISRARAVAVMVGAPALLDHRVSSIEDVRIANAVCRFVERCYDCTTQLAIVPAAPPL